MRIEMCGPPTAGKSRLVKELVKRGIKRGPRSFPDQTPVEWQSFVNFVNDAYSGTSYKTLPSKTLASLGSAWVADNTIVPMVFDELVILCGFSMAIRFPSKYADRYFAEAPLPGILVYLTADIDTLMRRNEARGEKNRSEKTIRMMVACDKYIPVLKERGCKILMINTTNKPTTVITDRVLKEVRKLGKRNA